MSLEIGAPAPDWTLPDAHRTPVTLSSYRGERAALVVFYPFAFSRVCTGELCSVRDDLASFQNERVQILAVSCDPAPSLLAWSQDQGFDFPLLSDFWPHGAVSRTYGVFREDAGMPNRGTFLVDTSGVLRWSEVQEPGQARDQAAWRRAIDALAEV
ncbi:peroxiredoxin [Nakamurella endophytica]|uniref:Alkyl hydroperoxide reductase E n=1 Tax=Nakamurella endophytica TaxID=1748367 RepID=A0A917T1W5_9ACTN|nr:peroxiredoxin [Nakamurella endophytica]GGM06087.1 peroxiredoxin [Nakamurella endophytica]